jgi:hypothetical protein
MKMEFGEIGYGVVGWIYVALHAVQGEACVKSISAFGFF